MNQTAKVIKIDNKQSKSGTTFQDVVLEWNERDKEGREILKHLTASIFGQKVSDFNLNVGEKANFYYDIDAREYNGRWYNQLTIWKVSRDLNAAPAQAPAPAPEASQNDLF